MRIERTGWLIVVLGFLFVATFPEALEAQGSRWEFGGGYAFVHTNAPPGGCGCFSAEGGQAWAGWRYTRPLSLVGEFASVRASNISNTPAGIKLYTAMGGLRLESQTRHRLVPFGQALFGLAHATGDLTPATDGTPSSSNVFGMAIGGGADFVLGGRISARLVQADYFYTRFNNGVNNRQNNVRLSAGIVIRLSPSY